MSKTITYILIMSVVTYSIRSLPLLIVNREIESKFLKSFLHYIPFAVLASMTFPAILYSTGDFFTALIGLIIGVVLSFINSGLVTVATLTVVCVYLLSFLDL